MPNYLLKTDFLYPLVKNQHMAKWYTNNLCVFQCLALHRGHDIKSIEGPAQDFYKQSDQPAKDFEGLNFEDFPTFERLFLENLQLDRGRFCPFRLQISGVNMVPLYTLISTRIICLTFAILPSMPRNTSVKPGSVILINHSVCIGTNGLATRRRISCIQGDFTSPQNVFSKNWNNTISISQNTSDFVSGLFIMIWKLCWNQLMTARPLCCNGHRSSNRQHVNL